MENRKRLLRAKKAAGNNICFECKSVNPQFVSCSFGIFICVNCANLLRGMGTNIFCVKSITMDNFEEKDVRRVEKSGNNRFGSFLSKNGILQNGIPLREKYDNLFAKSYRGGWPMKCAVMILIRTCIWDSIISSSIQTVRRAK